MKLALLAGRFPVLSETFIYNHAAGLHSAGLDVTVVTARGRGDLSMFADFEGTKYEGPIRRAVMEGTPLDKVGRAVRSLRDARRRSLWDAARARFGLTRRAGRAWMLAAALAEFDIVHVEYTGLAIRWLDGLRLLAPARIVVSCRGAAEQIRPLVEPDRLDALREVFEVADRVHCVSEDMLRTCVSYGLEPAKGFVNRPAIDPRLFVRKQPYIVRSAGPVRLLSTGRLHWKKGLEFALLAVRELIDRGHDVRYQIVGAGDDEERLRFAVHDLGLAAHVSFAGKLSSTEVRRALESADIYVLPSVSEGLSNAALEAMAMELPVVASTAGGMSEAIRDGIDGLLVPPRQPLAMADRIAVLLAAPQLRASLGAAARKRVLDDFSLERQIRVYRAEYAALSKGAETV